MGNPQETDSGEWELVKEKEICQRLKVSPRKLYELRASRLIPYVLLGSKRTIRYSLPAVRAAIERLTVPSWDD